MIAQSAGQLLNFFNIGLKKEILPAKRKNGRKSMNLMKQLEVIDQLLYNKARVHMLNTRNNMY